MTLNLVLLAATNIVLYVSNSGSDTNNGYDTSAPLHTIQQAVDVATTEWRAAANASVTIQVSDGTYAGAVLRRGIGPGNFKIVGTPSSPSSAILTNSGTTILSVPDGGVWTINACTFSGSAAGYKFGAYINGVIFHAGNPAGVNLLPDNIAGFTQTGGQYQ